MLDLGRTFLQTCERSPRATALVDGSLRITYAEWLERICRVARGLSNLGLARGDHLLMMLQNRWETATLHWACQFLGAIVTPINWRAKPEELEFYASNAEAKAVAFEPASAEAVGSSSTAGGIPRIAVGGATGGTISFSSLLSQGSVEPPLNAGADDFSVMFYTSGTSGKPKGVPRRHRHERAATLAHIAQNLYGPAERTLGVMPLHHTMGVRLLLSTAMVDGVFVCLPRFDATQALRAIAEERITSLYLVPTLYHDILAHSEFEYSAVSSVRKVAFAGAPMHEALLKRVEAGFRPQLFVNHYGSSEVYTLAINQNAVRKPSCAGRAGINARIRVVTLDARSFDDFAAVGQTGEIIADLAGDEAFEGYWKRPDADVRAIRNGWYFTGDTGYVDADGDLFVTGRVDDMIISGGENISPVAIEAVLSLHAGVEDVAVVGLPDERWGQRVVAFIKRNATVEPEMLDLHCRSSDVVNFMRPREYIFVREIPRSQVGKVLRRKLIAGEYEPEPNN